MNRRAKASIAGLILLVGLIAGVTIAAATAPTATINAPTNVDANEADLSGHVVAEDASVFTCRFEYVTDAQFSDPENGGFAQAEPNGQLADCDAFPEAGTEADVTAHLSGLSPSTFYHVRLHADNGEASDSTVETFETDSVATPVVSADDASNVSYTTADLSGTVEVPAGADDALNASCRFEYLTQEAYEAQGNDFPAEGAPSIPCQPETIFGEEAQPVSVTATLSGLSPATTYHLRIFASNLGGNDDAEAPDTFTTDSVAAPEVTIDAPAAITDTTASFSGQVNPNAPGPAPQDPAWTFSCTPECPGLEGGTVAADDDPHPISVDATGLEPNTPYTVTLTGASAGGEDSDQTSFTTDAAAPTVGDNASGAGYEKAIIAGFVNPHNTSTDYWFEWGTQGPCSANPCAATPAHTLATGNQPVHVHAALTGLTPQATYSYRLVAESSQATVAGRERTILISTALPDDRAYELVSPPDKNGSDITFDTSRTRVADDGDAVSFISLAGIFADARGAGFAGEYLAQRTAAGWNTHSISPLITPATLLKAFGSGASDPRFVGLSADLRSGIFLARDPLTPEGPNVANVANLYLRGDLRSPGPGDFSLISDSVSPFPAAGTYRPEFIDASDDFTHLLFMAGANLTPGLSPQPAKCAVTQGQCERRVYEWVQGEGLRHVGILPDDECEAAAQPPGCPAIRSFPGNAVNGFSFVFHAISADGSRIFFTVQPTRAAGPGRLYMREDGDTTVRIDVSERTDCSGDPTCGGDDIPNPLPRGDAPARYEDASEDGSVVYFTTEAQLTDEPTGGIQTKLYRYDVSAPAGHHLTLVSADRQPADPGFKGTVLGMIGLSADGEYAYFLADSQLVDGATPLPPGTDQAIFVWHAGETRYVGRTYAGDDYFDLIAPGGVGLETLFGHQLTPAGTRFVFTSRAASGLTGYQKESSCNDQSSSCREVYVYDYQGSTPTEPNLTCVSCRPDGTHTTSDSGYGDSRGGGGAGATTAIPRAISSDGRSVFFYTRQSLVPEDQNGARMDVYVYDVPSAQVSLLSTGRSDEDSFFVGSSPSGADAFFLTRERLLGIDVDRNVDLYDARVDGGLSAQNPPPRDPPCEGDACQPPPLLPDDPTPASAGLSAPAKPRIRCPKKKHRIAARRKTRCHSTKRNRANPDRRTSR